MGDPPKKEREKEMKKFKRILAMFMAMVMVLGMAVTASAAGPATGTSADTGTIIVKGIEDTTLTGDNAVKAYPIAMAAYANNGHFSGYTNPHGIADIKAPTKEEIDAIDLNEIEPITLSYDSINKDYRATGQAVGMYLIVVPGNESTTYSRAVASIYYTSGDTQDMIVDGDLTMATTTADGAAWVKKQVDVTVDKKVNNLAGTTAKIGEVLKYDVTINPVPKYSGEHPTLNVTDILSKGLEYQKPTDATGVKVYVDGQEIDTAKYTVDFVPGTRTLTVNFVVDNKYTMNDYAGKAAVIEYYAKLTKDAVLNNNANDNDVTLNYTKDSTVTGKDDQDKDKTHTYTFDIDGQTTGSLTSEILNKYGEEVDSTTGDKKPLEGATFTLYATNPDEDENAEPYTTDVFGGTTTTDVNGQVKITGLPEGTYYLKETAVTDTSYSLNSHVFEIVIDADIDATTGLLKSWTITIDGDATSTFTVDNAGTATPAISPTNIQNTKLSSLPSTGGIGTYIFTIAGIIIMAAAAGFFFVSRRKANR